MIFTCDKNKLQESIAIAQKAITGKSTMPILEGLYIEASENIVTIIGSDKDVSIETKFEANITEPGKLVVDAKIFGEIIRKLPNDKIKIETVSEEAIRITCQKSVFDLLHMNAEDFPSLPKINENMIFSINQGILKNMIKGTSFAIAQDETRPILQGILFEIKDSKLNLVALDGYRLAIRTENIDTNNTINAVIPGKTLNEVAKILEDSEEIVNITFTPNHILFNMGDTKVISRLLEGEFIKYDALLPKEHKLQIEVDKQTLQNGIERASLMAKEGNSNLVKFDITDENIVITSNSQLGKVREEVTIKLQGDEIQIAFNSKYLLDVLKNMEEDKIELRMTSSISPCIIRNKNNDLCEYLVLPVRIAR
ncbi:DNA polymerase III subunit beta [Clostridium perfringens]|nr:DNA polymerase III subunit beta [Clostridium perfringens]